MSPPPWQSSSSLATRLCGVGVATRTRTALDGTTLPGRYPVIASAIAAGTLAVDSAAVIVKELDAASVLHSTALGGSGENSAPRRESETRRGRVKVLSVVGPVKITDEVDHRIQSQRARIVRWNSETPSASS